MPVLAELRSRVRDQATSKTRTPACAACAGNLPHDAPSFWVSWPKRASKVPTDITENTIPARGRSGRWVLSMSKFCAVTDVLVRPQTLVVRKGIARGPAVRSAPGGITRAARFAPTDRRSRRFKRGQRTARVSTPPPARPSAPFGVAPGLAIVRRLRGRPVETLFCLSWVSIIFVVY